MLKHKNNSVYRLPVGDARKEQIIDDALKDLKDELILENGGNPEPDELEIVRKVALEILERGKRLETVRRGSTDFGKQDLGLAA